MTDELSVEEIEILEAALEWRGSIILRDSRVLAAAHKGIEATTLLRDISLTMERHTVEIPALKTPPQGGPCTLPQALYIEHEKRQREAFEAETGAKYPSSDSPSSAAHMAYHNAMAEWLKGKRIAERVFAFLETAP